MKKLITAMLALLLCVSLVTVFTACDENEDHTHTFAEGWTSDATHHWHAATCEHVLEASEKAEHTFGEDDKCTVCQKEYTSPATTTAENWSTAIQNMQNAANIKYDCKAELPGDNAQRILGEIEGDRYHLTKYRNGAFSVSEILIKTGESTYDLYTQSTENGAWVKSTPSAGEVNDITKTAGECATFAQVAVDKFADAVFDKATGLYTLEVESAVVMGMNLNSLVYTFGFENGSLSKVNLQFMMGQWVYDIDFTFGNASVTVPQV